VLFHPKQFDDELGEEMRGHIERLVEEGIRTGLSHRDARKYAARRFGNGTIVQEQSKEVWIYRWLETLIQDIRYGLRMIARSPGFAAVAVLSLALGVGANTAIFTVIDALMLKALPVREPSRLVDVELADYKIGDFTVASLSYPAYARLRDDNQVFDGILASGNGGPIQFVMSGSGGSGQVESASLKLVSGNYFTTLGVPALIGRTLSEEDDRVGAGNPVAVVSNDYWKRRFNRDPSVVGKSFDLTDTSFTIIGVLPAGFFGTQVGDSPEMFAPLAIQPLLAHGESMLDKASSHWLSLMARLKPGMSNTEAEANSNTIYRQALEENASNIKDARSREQFLRQHLKLKQGLRGQTSWMRNSLSTSLIILMCIVAMVLLIACANIANLMLARGSARRKEISVRLALGASRSRLIRQLVTESLILAIAGGLAGLFLASAGSASLVRLVSTGSQPLVLDTQPDLGVFAFTAVVSVLTALLFGVAPAFRATMVNLAPSLNERTGSLAGSGHRLGKILVSAQIALALLLLIGAGLFARTFQKLSRIDLGFDQAHLYQVSWDTWSTGYKNQRLAAIFDEAAKRVSALPGVQSVSLSTSGLFSRTLSFGPVIVEGSTSQNENDDETCHFDSVGASFFRTVGMTIVRGRGFGAEDTATSSRVAVINETAAHRYFGETNPVGKRVYTDNDRKAPIEIVGIVKDAKYQDLRPMRLRCCIRSIFRVPRMTARIYVALI